MDWNIIETRPYMRCLIDMGMIYLGIYMYNDAIACLRQFSRRQARSFGISCVYDGCLLWAANWDHGRKVYQRYLACCDDIQNAFNHGLRISCCLCICCIFCGFAVWVKARWLHDVLADLVDEYEDIDWLLQDATPWNDFVEDHLEAIMYMVDQVSNIDSDPRELINLYTAISFLPTQLVDFESPLWQTLYDAYERVTGRTVYKSVL